MISNSEVEGSDKAVLAGAAHARQGRDQVVARMDPRVAAIELAGPFDGDAIITFG